MKSPVLKRGTQRRLAIAALLLVPALAACGLNPQTDQVYQAAAGPNDRSGPVNVLDAVIVSATPGSGTFAGTLVNKTDEVVQVGPVTGDGITSATGGNAVLTVPANGANNLGAAGDTVPPAKLTIAGDPTKIVPGNWVSLTFTFSTGSTVTINVPIVPVTDVYDDVPLPQPSAAPSKRPRHPSTPDASATAQ